ncbi:MAG: hypothetical protein CM1200mP14_18080 [Gammaproteobacteria bacterium]|nr:MAG: hypothetical protein CM1200mP14_18080 [Gammaproteobacteria bacterium]
MADGHVSAGREGRLAEIFGSGALEHDRIARLIKYRGPWTDEEFKATILKGAAYWKPSHQG